MHLFILHSFSDLDTLAPVIYKLDCKSKGIVKILSVFPVHDLRNYEVMKFLLKLLVVLLKKVIKTKNTIKKKLKKLYLETKKI